MYEEATQSANAYVNRGLGIVGEAQAERDRDDLASLHKRLEGYVDQAESLASCAGQIADQVFGTRPVNATGNGAPVTSSLASTVERLARALNSIQANLNRL